MEAAQRLNIITNEFYGRLLKNAGEPRGSTPHPFVLMLMTLKHAWQPGDQPDKFYYLLWTTLFRKGRLPTDDELRGEGCVRVMICQPNCLIFPPRWGLHNICASISV